MDKDRLQKMEEASIKRLEDASEKYPDIKLLFDAYKKLQTQEIWSEEFLKGYLSCISDLVFIKKIK